MKNKHIAMTAALFFSTGLVQAQQPAAGIAKHTNLPLAATPVLGYTIEAGSTSIQPIFGTVGHGQLGGAITPPEGTVALYLPPCQQYALIETASGLAVWPLLKTVSLGETAEGRPVAGGLTHADLVAFSARGEAAAVYSKESGELALLGGLPGTAHVVSKRSLRGLGEVSRLTVSDDAAVVAVEFSDSRLMYAMEGGRLEPMSNQYLPAAWSFVPKTHDLVISDVAQQVIVIYPQVHGSVRPVATQGIQATELAFTKDADQLLASNSEQGLLWDIQLASGTVSPLTNSKNLDRLLTLRDGRTFLLSVSPALGLIKALVSSDTNASAMPAITLKVQ